MNIYEGNVPPLYLMKYRTLICLHLLISGISANCAHTMAASIISQILRKVQLITYTTMAYIIAINMKHTMSLREKHGYLQRITYFIYALNFHRRVNSCSLVPESVNPCMLYAKLAIVDWVVWLINDMWKNRKQGIVFSIWLLL